MAISLQYFKKEVSDEVDFLHGDKHKSLLQIDTTIWMEIVKHFQSSQNIKFAMSLQYLKKEVMEFTFCVQITIKFSASWHYRFWWKWSNMSKVPKIGSWYYFCNILRKKCHNCFCVLLWCKTFRYFVGVMSCLLLLLFPKMSEYTNSFIETECLSFWWKIMNC